MKNILKLLALSYESSNFSGAGQSFSLAHKLLNALKEARPTLAFLISGRGKTTSELPMHEAEYPFQSARYKHIKFLAKTRNGDFGIGEANGYHLYFEGRREDIFNNPITHWYVNET